MKRRSSTGTALHLNPSSMGLHQFLDDRQAYPETASGSLVEPFEDEGKLLFSDSRPAVLTR